jgi:drug/metabolite transporter (DMT)-like permease
MRLPAALGLLANGTFLAIIANGIIGISLVWDKVLLNRPETKSLPNYIFWLGAISVFGLLLIPFGFHMPVFHLALIAMAAGATLLAASWFYYAALKTGEASEALAVTGGFAPLATALIAIPLLGKPLGDTSVAAFALMALGGFVMFGSEKFNWRRVLPPVLIAAFLFGISNVLQKLVFNSTGFVSGYVFFTVGTFLAAVALLVRPAWRKQILEQSEEAPPKSRFWYFVNRFISGVGSFLIFLAISKTSPAAVAAIAGVRYAIIFAAAFLLTRLKPQWLRENFRGGVLIGKSAATALIVAGLALAASSGGGAARSQ